MVNMLLKRVPKEGRRMSLEATKELERDGATDEAREDGVEAPGVRLGVTAEEERPYTWCRNLNPLPFRCTA